MEVEENAGAGGWASTSSGSSPGKEEPAPTAFFVRESEHLGFVRKEAPNAASHAAGRSLLAGKLPDLALRKPADGSLNSTDGRFESSLEAFLSNQENAAPLLDRTSSGELAAVHEKAISKTAWPLAAEKSVTTNTAAKKELPGSSSSQLDNSDCPIGLPEHLAPEGLPSAPSREGFSQAKLSPVIPRLEITDQSQSAGARGVNASGPSPVADISMDLEQWTQAARLAWQWTNTIRKELETAQCSNTQLQAEVVRLTEAQRSLGACGGGGDPEGAVQAMLEQCREELAQERATSENLRHYYGCGGEELEREPESGANNTTDTELLKRCQLEVTDLKAQSGKQVEQIAQLTIQLAEAKAEKTLPNSGVEDQLQGDQKEGAGGAAPSEVELLRVQVAALKEIVSIQDEGVVRKAQRGGSAGKEDDRGGESDSEPRNMFRLSDSLPKGNAAGCPAERDPSQADNGSPRMDSHERFRDEGTGGGIQFVKALLGRWRGEVYALVLKMKEREWEAVREAAKVGEELDRERGLREETNSRCKVLEQRAISLTAELQIQRDAAERTAQSLSALRKEHTSAKAGLATAESAIRSLCTAVQQWQQKEEAGLQRLAESERRLEGFARRLRFAEGRLAVGRELGRGKREGRGQEAVYAGKGGRSGEPSEFVLRGVATMAGRSGEGHSGQGREGQTISGVHSKENRGTGERGREGEARTMAAAVEEPSRQETGRVEGFTRNGQDELAGTVAGNQAERREWPLFGRGQLERRAGEARGGVGGESEELEAEVERLQRERAMLVGRHLEGGVELTSLAARVEDLEVQLTRTRERADNAEERAANLEELLASARASLAREGETVQQLQARVRDLESSSKKALARELRRAEEQARADLAAAAEAHDAESAALRAKVAALERETAKAAVNLRQLERHAAQVKEQRTHERDARISELEARLERQDADLRAVRRERSVLLAQLRKLERDAHSRKRGIGEGGLHAEVVRTPAPRSERKPLVETGRNGALGGTRGGSPGEDGWLTKKSLSAVATGVAMSDHVASPGLDGFRNGQFEENRELQSPPLAGRRPGSSEQAGGVGLHNPGLTTPPHRGIECLDTLEGPAQRRRVSEVLDESGHDLMLRLNKLAMLSSAILDESVGQ